LILSASHALLKPFSGLANIPQASGLIFESKRYGIVRPRQAQDELQQSMVLFIHFF
jgi:hypothetical protein